MNTRARTGVVVSNTFNHWSLRKELGNLIWCDLQTKMIRMTYAGNFTCTVKVQWELDSQSLMNEIFASVPSCTKYLKKTRGSRAHREREVCFKLAMHKQLKVFLLSSSNGRLKLAANSLMRSKGNSTMYRKKQLAQVVRSAAMWPSRKVSPRLNEQSLFF